MTERLEEVDIAQKVEVRGVGSTVQGEADAENTRLEPNRNGFSFG